MNLICVGVRLKVLKNEIQDVARRQMRLIPQLKLAPLLTYLR